MEALGAEPGIGPEDYKKLRRALIEKSGIDLGEEQAYLVDSRIRPLLKEFPGMTVSELVDEFALDTHKTLSNRVLNVLTTHETTWFRDIYPFDILKHRILPDIIQTLDRNLKIWCAACSSGQEPFSVSILLSEYMMSPLHAWKGPAEIIATDLSTAIIKQAQTGCFKGLSALKGLSNDRKMNFIETLDATTFKIRAKEAERVQFYAHNLTEKPNFGQFHVIFCRNVLIYFPPDIKRKVIQHLKNALLPKGYLVLGGSEFINSEDKELNMVKCEPGIIYQKN